jgi:hypothetical protein
MITVLTLAIEKGISAYFLSKIIFPYPIKSEVIKKINNEFVLDTLSNIQQEIIFFLKNNFLQIITLMLWITIISVFFYFKQAN